MKKWINSNAFRSIAILALAVIMIAGASIRSAWSYFTTYATAKGGYIIHLGDQTDIEEDVSQWKKHIKIKSDADSDPVYIRARAYWGDDYTCHYEDSSGKWSPRSDGWYYYSDIVYGGDITDELVVVIDNHPEIDQPGPDFNVIVVYESLPVEYDSNGNIVEPDWNKKVNDEK